MIQTASALTGRHGEKIALTDVAIRADIADLLAEVTVAQTYRNDEAVNIEAVYTFPLPQDAVLLEFEVRLGERVLKGVVKEKKEAEARYEEAIAKGDAAVMLEVVEPGLYTVNVGNLLPGETAILTCRYGMIYRWAGDQLRIFVPTTVAPRYGASPLQPHQVPQASLTVENRFSLELAVSGSLTQAQFDCPSHPVTLSHESGRMVLRLALPHAVMDRDFILNVKAPQAVRSFALSGPDGEGSTVLASFQPFFPGLRRPGGLKVAFLVDCSGSMAGESMQQVKHALAGIFERLRAEDRVSIIAFGNNTRSASSCLVPCTPENLQTAHRFAQTLDANMGGTEIGSAIEATHALIGDTMGADIFLITDGEVADWQSVVARTQTRGRRFFTIGVGNAVSEAFVRSLAESTGGQCELVSPRENMAERVVRHFERMRAPRAKAVRVLWPDGARDVTPAAIGSVFEGDTVLAWARFDHAVANAAVTLEVETESGVTGRETLPIRPLAAPATADNISTLARLGGAARLSRETALRYRLVSKWTNYLVVAARAEGEAATDMPALRQVPHMLAAGWGGTGRVDVAADCLDDAMRDYSRLPSSAVHDTDHFYRIAAVSPARPFATPAVAPPIAPSPSSEIGEAELEFADLVEDLSTDDDIAACEIQLPRDPALLRAMRSLAALVTEAPQRLTQGSLVDLLTDSGLLPTFESSLKQARDGGLDVEGVAALLLCTLLVAWTTPVLSGVPAPIRDAFLAFARESGVRVLQAAPGGEIERMIRQQTRYKWRRLLQATEAAEKTEAARAGAVS